MKKFLFGLAIILAIVIIGLFVYYQKNSGTSSDNNISWQTYRNEKLGFQLDYPADWKVNDSSFVYDGIPSIAFRVTAPSRIIPQSNGRVVFFDMLICKTKDGVFTDVCSQSGAEEVSFDYPHKTGDQTVDSVEGISSFIKTTPEYITALKILKSAR